MNRFGLTSADIELIKTVITQNSCVRHAIIFGSRAKGNFKRGSDVDIALKGEDIDASTIDEISYQLNEELPLPYFFDVIHYDRLNHPDLKAHIDRVGETLY